MVPSFIVIGLAINTTEILVMSQVVLSFGIALAIIPLLIFTNNEKLMGVFKNNKYVSYTGIVIIALVVALNIYLMMTLIKNMNKRSVLRLYLNSFLTFSVATFKIILERISRLSNFVLKPIQGTTLY